jgi:hypothetical protein
MNLKDMIAKMDAIEAPSKKQKLEESASMNISMTADDAGQVGQLMAMMRNAGMSPEKVSDKPLTPRMDMEKHMKALGAMDDDPEIPGRDDVDGDMDLKAGTFGTLAGGGAGALAGEKLDKATGGVASDLAAQGAGAVADLVVPGSSAIVKPIAKAIAPGVAGAMVGGKIGDKITGEDYENSPDEQYSPAVDVTNPPSNDLNKSKKSYPKVAGGDNPRALADKIKEELSSLYSEYKG